MRTLSAWSIGLASVLLAPSTWAQGIEAEARIDTLQPASAGSPYTRAEGPWKEFDEGIAYAFRLNTEYNLAPLQSFVEGGAVADDTEIRPVAHALLGHIGASLSPLYWLNLELNFTFAPFETGDDDQRVAPQQLAAGKPGIGDTRVGAHLRPITSPEFGLSLGGRWWGPTGSEAAYLSGKSKFSRFEFVPAVVGAVDLFEYGCTLGIAPLFFGGRDGDRLAASCAAHFKLAPMIALGFEPHFAVFSYSPVASQQKPSEHVPGMSNADFAVQFEPTASVAFSFGDFSLGVSGGPGLGGAPGVPKARAMLTLGWAARGERVVEEVVADADLDGIADEYDACPDAAGPKDRRGCPDERDTDGDGIIEGDACPDEPGASYEDPEANGCPDRDNDHLADPIDPCPAEPGVSSGGCPKFARLEQGDFVLDPPIKFNAGSWKLSKDAVAAITEVVATMRANPKIEQVSIVIGSKRSSPRLTDKRAATVLKVLNEQNFDSSRYELVLKDDLKAGELQISVVK